MRRCSCTVLTAFSVAIHVWNMSNETCGSDSGGGSGWFMATSSPSVRGRVGRLARATGGALLQRLIGQLLELLRRCVIVLSEPLAGDIDESRAILHRGDDVGVP